MGLRLKGCTNGTNIKVTIEFRMCMERVFVVAGPCRGFVVKKERRNGHDRIHVYYVQKKPLIKV